MDVEKTTYHQWRLDKIPGGSRIWCCGIGHLEGFGHSRRKLLLYDLIPHMVISGSGTYICNGQKRRLKTGDLFTVWPGLAYEFFEDSHNPWQFYWILLKGSGAEEFGHICGFAPDNLTLTPSHPERILDTIRVMFEYYASPPSKRDPVMAMAMLYGFVAELRKNISTVNKDVHETNRAILVKEAVMLAETLLDQGINIEELARRLQTSRNNLLMAFKETLNESPIEYLGKMRLKRAEHLLQHTDWPVAAVSEACGYRNDKYFMRVFKKKHGETPSSWRRM